MGVRFDGNVVSNLQLTGTLPPTQSISVIAFASLTANTNGSFAPIVGIFDSATTPAASAMIGFLATSATVSELSFFSNGSGSIALSNASQITSANGRWVVLAWVQVGTAVKAYWGYPGGALRETIITGDSFTPAAINIGADPSGFSDGTNATIGGVRIWRAQLTKADLEVEARSLHARRRGDLFAEWVLEDKTRLIDTAGQTLRLVYGDGTGASIFSGGDPPATYYPVNVRAITSNVSAAAVTYAQYTYYPDSIQPALSHRLLRESGIISWPPITPDARLVAPRRQDYPDQVIRPAPHPALMRDVSYSLSPRPERTSALVSANFPDQALGAPPRRDLVTEAGKPERTTVAPVETDFPSQLIGATPRRDYATEVGAPERASAAFGLSFPDQILPATPRKDHQTEVGSPERNAPLVETDFPSQILGAPPRSDFVTVDGRPERTSPLAASSFPDAIPTPLVRPGYVTEAAAPIVASTVPVVAYVSAPEVLRAPVTRPDAWTRSTQPEQTLAQAPSSYPDRAIVLGPRSGYSAQQTAPEATNPGGAPTSYPERVRAAPTVAQQREVSADLPAAPERTSPLAAASFPDQVFGPPPRKDAVTVVAAPERTSALVAASFPDQVLGAPPRKDAVTVEGSPERNAPVVPASFPEQVLGAPPRRDVVTEAGKPLPNLAAPVIGYASYPDTVPGPQPRQQQATTEQPPSPIPDIPKPQTSYPAQLLRPGGFQAHQQPWGEVPPRPESTLPVTIASFPDSLPARLIPSQDPFTRSYLQAPVATFTVYPDRVVGRIAAPDANASEPFAQQAPTVAASYPGPLPGRTSPQDVAPRSQLQAPVEAFTSYPDRLAAKVSAPDSAFYPMLVTAAPTSAYASYPDAFLRTVRPTVEFVRALFFAPPVVPLFAYQPSYPEIARRLLLDSAFRTSLWVPLQPLAPTITVTLATARTLNPILAPSATLNPTLATARTLNPNLSGTRAR